MFLWIQIKKLLKDEGKLFENPRQYRWLVGKLNYLMVTKPYISYAVSVVSQFHWDALIHTVHNLKRAPTLGILYRRNENNKVEGFTNAD
jgi:hypothetical protein